MCSLFTNWDCKIKEICEDDNTYTSWWWHQITWHVQLTGKLNVWENLNRIGKDSLLGWRLTKLTVYFKQKSPFWFSGWIWIVNGTKIPLGSYLSLDRLNPILGYGTVLPKRHWLVCQCCNLLKLNHWKSSWLDLTKSTSKFPAAVTMNSFCRVSNDSSVTENIRGQVVKTEQ